MLAFLFFLVILVIGGNFLASIRAAINIGGVLVAQMDPQERFPGTVIEGGTSGSLP